MKVCDQHPQRKAVDTVYFAGDDMHIDVCADCKSEVLNLFSITPKQEEPAKKKKRWFGKDSAQAE